MTIHQVKDRTGAKRPGQALGYARVSTDEQAREGVSLDAQQSRIRAYCEAKELELVDMLTDDGISGKTLERPALRELLQRCERGEGGARCGGEARPPDQAHSRPAGLGR